MEDGIDRAAAVRARIEKAYADGFVFDQDGNRHEFGFTSVSPRRGAFIRDLCISAGATRSIETGMAWGLSALFIVEGLVHNGAGPRAHVAMDPRQLSRFNNAALRLLREAGVDDLVEFYNERSDLILPKLALEGRQVDFAFIDGDHGLRGAFVDFIYADKLLRPGGIVVFDDSDWDGVELTCKFAESNGQYEPIAKFTDKIERETASHRAKRTRTQEMTVELRAYRKPAQAPVPDPYRPDPFSIRRMPWPRNRRLRAVGGNFHRASARQALREGDAAKARTHLVESLRYEPLRIKTYLSLAKMFFAGGKKPRNGWSE